MKGSGKQKFGIWKTLDYCKKTLYVAVADDQ